MKRSYAAAGVPNIAAACGSPAIPASLAPRAGGVKAAGTRASVDLQHHQRDVVLDPAAELADDVVAERPGVQRLAAFQDAGEPAHRGRQRNAAALDEAVGVEDHAGARGQ